MKDQKTEANEDGRAPALAVAPCSARLSLIDAINEIPAWKRWLICQLLRRSEWKVARAYNVIACHAVNKLGDYALFEDMRRRGDEAWAKVYGLPNIRA